MQPKGESVSHYRASAPPFVPGRDPRPRILAANRCDPDAVLVWVVEAQGRAYIRAADVPELVAAGRVVVIEEGS
jgi:hypothetical protein